MASTIYWPDNLPDGVPLPLRDGYGYTPRSPSMAKEFALVTRSRQVFSDAPVDFSAVQWLCSQRQKDYLMNFWWHQLGCGTKSFWMRLRVNGDGLELREVNFYGRIPVPEQLVGVNHWRVSGAVTTVRGTQSSLDSFLGHLNFNDDLIG